MFNKASICSLIIILFHFVGLYGFLTPEYVDIFIKLVPFHLLLMLLLIVISGYDRSTNIILFSLLTYLLGFLVEVAGVNSGLIFGSYTYGNTLGIKIWQTPLLIGVNWLVLVYTTGIVLSTLRLNKYLLPLIGATILVGIDFLIEPVAIKYDYWSWSEGIIPLQNYLGWFIVSFIMFFGYGLFDFKKQNKSAIVLFIAQICFFITLNTWST
jgi:putative membrane protein